jgi:hypothetical protein
MLRLLIGFMWVGATGAIAGMMTYGVWINVPAASYLSMLLAAVAGAAFGFMIMSAVWAARQLP